MAGAGVQRPSCACDRCLTVETTPEPSKFALPRSIAGNGLVARVVVDKFADNIPLNRQVDRFVREGLDLSLSTLCDLVRRAAGLLKRIVDAMRVEQRAGSWLQTDDTGLPVLDGTKGQAGSGRLWVYANDEHVAELRVGNRGRGGPTALAKWPCWPCGGLSEHRSTFALSARRGQERPSGARPIISTRILCEYVHACRRRSLSSMDLPAGGPMEYERRRLLIWGRTYPETSKKYVETVCTGAVDMDEPRLLRIYPLADRYLSDDHKTPKWRIISAEVARTSSDRRPESYRIQPLSIRGEGQLDTTDGWAERRRILLRDEFLVGGIEDMERRQQATGQSLGIVKPLSIEDVIVRRVSRADLEERRSRYEEIYRQQELWPPGEAPVPPRQFDVRVRFRGPDDGRVYDRVILDWEVYALAGNLRTKGRILEENLRDALLRGALDLTKKDVHFMLGNISSHPQEFVVVAMFYPPIARPAEPVRQIGLFG